MDELLKKIEAYCREVGVAETTFGKRVVNDGKLVARLRSGKTISLSTFNRILLVLDEGRVGVAK
ncbi:hypothetical protein FJU08_17435 [Martelella alba]|uniref:Uncharacterized protein n=1 Tax=Martelella alba TaxID=2590451 RepID=A0A506U5E4_9HYPH|nr:hypothetical protein [Martelella alba]TPW28586.1 hypothetical protein FJU08_17435 [Martelella alba]